MPLTPSASLPRLLGPVLCVALLWGLLLSAVLFLTGEGPAVPRLTPVFVIGYLLLMAWSCALCTLVQEPQWRYYDHWRRPMLAASLLLAAGLFAAVRQGLLTAPWVIVLIAVSSLVFALLLGNYLVTALTRPAELVAVCSVMSIADLLSVLAGPSKEIAAAIETYYVGGRQAPPPWSDFLLVKIALPGYDYLQPIFGLADLIMVAFLIGAAHKFRIDDRVLGSTLQQSERARPGIYLPLPVAGLTIAILMAHWLQMFIPALPVIAALFLGITIPRDRRLRQLQRTERFAVLISCVILGGFLATRLASL